MQPVGGNFASVLYPTDYLEYTGTCAGPRQRGRAATLPTTSWLVLTCVCCCAPVLQATARTTRTACTVCSPWLTQLQPSNSWCVCVYAWSCATARAPPQCAAVAGGPARDVGLWACDCASVEQVQRYFALPNMSLAEVRVGGQGSGLAPPMFTSTRSVPAAAARDRSHGGGVHLADISPTPVHCSWTRGAGMRTPATGTRHLLGRFSRQCTLRLSQTCRGFSQHTHVRTSAVRLCRLWRTWARLGPWPDDAFTVVCPNRTCPDTASGLKEYLTTMTTLQFDWTYAAHVAGLLHRLLHCAFVTGCLDH